MERKSPELRLLGINGRPPASCSNLIAAAVVSLLDEEGSDELDVARYALSSNLDGGRRLQLVSFYLDVKYARPHDALVRRPRPAVEEIHERTRREAQELFPVSPGDAADWYVAELRHAVPLEMTKVPRGVLARMAIDRWARRNVDEVAAAGVAYAADTLAQPHPSRTDSWSLGG